MFPYLAMIIHEHMFEGWMSTQYYVVCEFLICNTDLYALLNLTKNLLNLSTAIQSCKLYFQWNFSTHSLIFVDMLCFYCYFVKLSHTKSQVKCKSVVMPQKLNQIKTIHWQISLIILNQECPKNLSVCFIFNQKWLQCSQNSINLP